MAKLIFLKIVVCMALVWLGSVIFNHTPYPFLGLALAIVYPVFLVFQMLKGFIDE